MAVKKNGSSSRPAAAGPKQISSKPGKPAARLELPSTRERILAYLEENRTTSAVELARLWGFTRADLRYHLSQLQKEGVIEPAPRDPSQALGPGRPVVRYRLSKPSGSQQLGALCRALLGALLVPQQVGQRDEALRELAIRLAGEPNPDAPLTRRLGQAVAHLKQAQYHARWEAHSQGPRILLRTCPYAALLADFPELCQMDQYLLERLLDAQVRPLTHMNIETGQPPACVFSVQPRSE